MKHYIALADCDCFFVSAERANNHNLDALPIAVITGSNGCVVSRSKEAKALGLKMGEPYFMARKRLPNITYIKANHELYNQTSSKVMNMLKSFTPDVEICSVDEAYLDLTGTKLMYRQNYIQTAQMIRQQILKELHIPISIGLSYTKTLAKLASDKAKNTNGIYAIGSAKRQKVLSQTLISDVSGVGKKLMTQMREACIFTALDFVSRPDHWIKCTLGLHGMDLKNELLGNSLFKVTPNGKSPQSIQQTSSLKTFTTDINLLREELCTHIHDACRKARQEGAQATVIEVMLRTKDFQVLTMRQKLPFPTNQEQEIITPALKLLDQLYTPLRIWRSSGITLSNLTYSPKEQIDLFSSPKKSDPRLGKALDEIEAKFGKNIIRFNLPQKETSK